MRHWALAVSAVLLAGAPSLAVETVTIPRISLDEIPPDGREQLETLQAEIEELRETGSDAVGLAEAYGEFGKLCFVYDFWDAARAAWTNASALQPAAFRWHYYLGVVDGLEGELESAGEHLEAVLELEAEDLPTLIRLGQARLEEGLLSEAAAPFEHSLRLVPGNAAALYGLGRIAVAEGRFEAALAPLRQALVGQPDGSKVHHQLGLAYRGLGDLERARLHLSSNKGIAVAFPDPLMEQMVGMVQGAHMRARLGVQAQRGGRLELAVRLLREAIALDPANAWSRYNLGVAYREAGNIDAAAAEFTRAVELDPGYRNAHFNLAQLLAGSGDLEGAARHFRRASEIDSEDDLARLELAVALSRLGRDEEALAELETLAEVAPEFVEARLKLATFLIRLGRQDEAERLTEGILEGDATDAELARAHLLLARMREPADADRALAHYSAAVELDPSSTAAGYGLAMALGRLGRFVAAAERFDVLVGMEPEDPDLRMGQAMARLLGQDYEEARQALEAAHTRFPSNAALTHSLARLLATCPDDAVRDGERALTLAQLVLESVQSVDHAETLAMALAETGRFADAVAWQQRVVSQRRLQGAARQLGVSERYLSLFEQGRSVRAPWMEGG